MCYAASCNPTCGKCRPKRIVEATCPQCGGACSMGREEYLLFFGLPHKHSVIDEKILARGGSAAPTCKFCGADMVKPFKDAVVPEVCKKSQVLCGFPCGGRFEEPRKGVRPCQHMVPLKRVR